MAKVAWIPKADLIDALAGLDIGSTNTITRIVIDIRVGQPPVVHVDHWGTDRIIDMARVLAGDPDVRVDLGALGGDGGA